MKATWLKRDFAARFCTDREACTHGKEEYIQAVMEKARQKQSGQNKPE